MVGRGGGGRTGAEFMSRVTSFRGGNYRLRLYVTIRCAAGRIPLNYSRNLLIEGAMLPRVIESRESRGVGRRGGGVGEGEHERTANLN